MRVTSLKSFVPGTLTTRDGLAIMTARRMQEAILAATINSANLDWNLEKDKLEKKGGPAGAGPSRNGLEHLEEFNDFAVEAFAEGEADGERFGLGGDGEIGDGLRLDSAGGDGFREIGGGVGRTEGEMDDGLVGGAIGSSIGEEFEIVFFTETDHAGAGVAFAPCAIDGSAESGVEGDGLVDVFALDGDVMETV